MGTLRTLRDVNGTLEETRRLIQTADQEVVAFLSRGSASSPRIGGGSGAGGGGGSGLVVPNGGAPRESDYFLMERFIQLVRQTDGFRIQGFGVQPSVTGGTATTIRSGSG